MNDTISWDIATLKSIQSQLSTQINDIYSSIENIKNINQELESHWITTHSKQYFQRMENFYNDCRVYLKKFEDVSEELNMHCQELEKVDE